MHEYNEENFEKEANILEDHIIKFACAHKWDRVMLASFCERTFLKSLLFHGFDIDISWLRKRQREIKEEIKDFHARLVVIEKEKR